MVDSGGVCVGALSRHLGSFVSACDYSFMLMAQVQFPTSFWPLLIVILVEICKCSSCWLETSVKLSYRRSV